jgi:hypothetical protein
MEQVLGGHVILVKRSISPSRNFLNPGTDPSPLAQDDMLMEDSSGHKLFIQCSNDRAIFFTSQVRRRLPDHYFLTQSGRVPFPGLDNISQQGSSYP